MIPALYIHIPFCKKKCNYCDFISYAGKEELINEYVEALAREIEGLRDRGTEGPRTVFFGGGTPTLLEPKHFARIINGLVTRYALAPSGVEGLPVTNAEISIEANPGTADKAKLKALRQLGINRLSIGAQSFNDRHLQTLGRIHDSKTIFKFYDAARTAGFDNINLDLMSALPDQTLAEWKIDLQTAIDLKPEHLSIYNLQIEEGTPFWPLTHLPPPTSKPTSHLSLPHFQLPSEEIEAAMFEHAIEELTVHGYKHYEISNFAKPGHECQHNLVYWRNENYLGIGAGAHSHINGQRWANTNFVEEYISRFPSNSDQRETLFLGLRLLDGLPKESFVGFEKEVAELIADGLLEEKNGNYKLSRRGLFLGNLVFEKFV